MAGTIQLDIHDVLNLYGPAIYRVGHEVFEVAEPVQPIETPVATPIAGEPAQFTQSATHEPTSGITWKLKKTAPKVLFVIQAAEFTNKELTDLLKKIVESLGIPTEFVSFGTIGGQISLPEFAAMPAPFAVVFDQGLAAAANPVQVAAGEVFFTHPLAVLSADNSLKRVLWEYLKQVQSKLA
jgi:hypothetical protein